MFARERRGSQGLSNQNIHLRVARTVTFLLLRVTILGLHRQKELDPVEDFRHLSKLGRLVLELPKGSAPPRERLFP